MCIVIESVAVRLCWRLGCGGISMEGEGQARGGLIEMFKEQYSPGDENSSDGHVVQFVNYRFVVKCEGISCMWKREKRRKQASKVPVACCWLEWREGKVVEAGGNGWMDGQVACVMGARESCATFWRGPPRKDEKSDGTD